MSAAIDLRRLSKRSRLGVGVGQRTLRGAVSRRRRLRRWTDDTAEVVRIDAHVQQKT